MELVTMDRISYPHDTNSILVGYCDANCASNVEDIKSNSDGCFSKKLNYVSLSTTEARYVAARSSCDKVVFMNHMLKEYNVKQYVMTLNCGNMSAITILKIKFNIVVPRTLAFIITSLEKRGRKGNHAGSCVN